MVGIDKFLSSTSRVLLLNSRARLLVKRHKINTLNITFSNVISEPLGHRLRGEDSVESYYKYHRTNTYKYLAFDFRSIANIEATDRE